MNIRNESILGGRLSLRQILMVNVNTIRDYGIIKTNSYFSHITSTYLYTHDVGDLFYVFLHNYKKYKYKNLLSTAAVEILFRNLCLDIKINTSAAVCCL